MSQNMTSDVEMSGRKLTKTQKCFMEVSEEMFGQGKLFGVAPMFSSILCCLIYTVSGKKSLRFPIHNFNKFTYIFIIFGANNPDTSF